MQRAAAAGDDRDEDVVRPREQRALGSVLVPGDDDRAAGVVQRLHHALAPLAQDGIALPLRRDGSRRRTAGGAS